MLCRFNIIIVPMCNVCLVNGVHGKQMWALKNDKQQLSHTHTHSTKLDENVLIWQSKCICTPSRIAEQKCQLKFSPRYGAKLSTLVPLAVDGFFCAIFTLSSFTWLLVVFFRCTEMISLPRGISKAKTDFYFMHRLGKKFK